MELNLNIRNSALLTNEQKVTILEKLSNRISSEGVLQVITEEDRSQLRNKEKGLKKLIVLLRTTLYRPKLRKLTKPGRSAVEKRLKLKQATAIKKINRRGGDWD